MRIPILLATLATPMLAGGSKESATSEDGAWEWIVSAGPSIRSIGTLNADAGYRSKSVLVPSLVGGASQTLPPIGDTSSYADRVYNDGYVRQDAGTAADGSTWYWGYEENSQVQGNELVYSATGYQSTFHETYNIPHRGPSSRENLSGFAPHIQIEVRSPHRLGGLQVGFSGGLDFTRTDFDLSFSNYSGTQQRGDYRLDYEDRYALNGVIPPSGPYSGSLGGFGPLIDNLPASRSISPVLLLTDVASISNQVRTSLDLNVLSLTFGPSLSDRRGSFEFRIESGLILNIYDWNSRQTEQLDASGSSGTTKVAEWNETDSGTKFRPGLYAQTGVSYDVGDNCQIGGFMRLDTACEFRAKAGPTTFHIDPNGVTGGLMISWRLP